MGDRYLPLVGKRVPAARAGRYRPGMRRSIATVSLSGTLNEKLTAVANAGFDGVEIFDQDLLCSLWTPRRIKERCDELGLKIEMLQPFRDLEGMTEAQHAQAMRRFAGKLDIMAELGTDLILVCASCQPDAIDDALIKALKISKATYVVLHANHAQELSAKARTACARLIDNGFPMLSQTVLLNGVNADPATLEKLFRERRPPSGIPWRRESIAVRSPAPRKPRVSILGPVRRSNAVRCWKHRRTHVAHGPGKSFPGRGSAEMLHHSFC